MSKVASRLKRFRLHLVPNVDNQMLEEQEKDQGRLKFD